ncbi:hypothetical protein H9P43_000354 [Blastocladiella emersonii ATCC 22665]|nr:hypothetical protein H9P43_000354 [Blastocladiella emersonii ATCC 22665]
MSLKQELVQWDEAVKAYESGDYEAALDLFQPIADSSKIHYNLGMIYQSLGQHEDAIMAFGDSIGCDNFLSVAYFQQGVSLYILGSFEQADAVFEDALIYFRGTHAIDYTQLGLEYKLYACEVMYNRALVLFQLGDEGAALQLLAQAAKAKHIPDHDIINEAMQYRGDGCQLFQVPANLLYKPAKHKIANAGKVDYLGRSKVVAATDPNDNFIEFKGARGMNLIEPEPEIKPIRTLERKRSLPAEPMRVDTASRGPPRRPSAPTLSRRSPVDEAPRIDRAYPGDVADRGGYPSSPAGSSRNPGSMGRRRDDMTPPPNPPRSPYTGGRGGEPDYGNGGGGGGRGGGGADYMSSQGSIIQGKLRVKVDFGDKRMILLPGDASFDELYDKIAEKFNANKFRILFRDEDGELVTMTDDDDFLLARSLAPDENKIDVFCQ